VARVQTIEDLDSNTMTARQRDVQIRLLLGESLDLRPAEIDRDARRAADQFFALYGADENRPIVAGDIN